MHSRSETKDPNTTKESLGQVRHPKKVAYVLGAGFSAPAGLPLMREFMFAAFAKLKQSGRPDLACRFARLVEHYSRPAHALGLQVENMETLYCLVDSADLAAPSRRKDDVTVLTEIIAYTYMGGCVPCTSKRTSGSGGHMAETLSCKSVPRRYAQRPPPCIAADYRECANLGVCIYQAFLSRILAAQGERKGLKELDVIITFNYDLVLERALRGFGGALLCYGDDILGPKSQLPEQIVDGRDVHPDCLLRTVLLLKLHGSVNWCGASTDQHITEVLDPCDLEEWKAHGRMSRIRLQPPTWRKDAREDLFGKLARQVSEHLASAQKIVVIGYSFPETDQYFRYVLANVLSTPETPTIEIWGGQKRVEEMMPHLIKTLGEDMAHSNHVRYSPGGLAAFLTKGLAGVSDHG